MTALHLVFYFLVALGGFCIFINLLLSSFYGNAGLATSDSTDNQSAPAVVKFHLFSFPGISLILFFTGFAGLFLPLAIDLSLTFHITISLFSGILISVITGEIVTGLLGWFRSKKEGLEAVVRAFGTTIKPIPSGSSGKIRISQEKGVIETNAIEMFHRQVENGKTVRIIGIQNKTLIVEEVNQPKQTAV